MILACQNISKAFGANEILKQASFHIEEHEKAAIVGINGAGKSTLLKIIVGEMAADEGEVILARGKTLDTWRSRICWPATAPSMKRCWIPKKTLYRWRSASGPWNRT